MREAGKFTTVLQNNPPWTLQWDLTAGRGLRGAKFTSGRGCSLPASLQRFWGLGQGLCGFRVGRCGWWGGEGGGGGLDIFLSAVYCKYWRSLRFGSGAGH